MLATIRRRFPPPVLRAAVSVLAIGAAFAGRTAASAQITKVEWKKDLEFGDVWTGTTSTLQPDASNAAQWFVEANQGTQVGVTFALPANLVSAGNVLPIAFATNAAAWDRDSSTSGFTRFDPAQGAVVTMSSTKQLYVWLGGSISPPYVQPAGNYAGTITLIVTLN